MSNAACRVKRATVYCHALYLQEPEQFCSADTAVAMARAAYRRAAQLSPVGTPIVGLGATCSLATVGNKVLLALTFRHASEEAAGSEPCR